MNNITNISGKYDQAYVKDTTDTQRTDSRKGAVEETRTDIPQNDRVSLSTTSKDYQIAQEAVANTPDVRAEKVERIKQAVASGQYTVDAEKVAEKLIGTLVSEVV